MDKRIETSPPLDELLAGIWRHKKFLVFSVVVAVGIGVVYGALKPRVYSASTAVRMDSQVLPEQFVSPTVTETVQARLATIRHELLGEPVLSRVIREEGLFPDLILTHGHSVAVEAMRGRLEVRVEGENAFVVTYEASTPEEAARVANRIPEVYAEIAGEERAEAAARAAAIFASELENIRPQVESLEARLTTFKTRHAKSLPEVLESNLRQLDRLNGLTETALGSLADAQRRRTALARVGAENNVEVARLAAAMNEARRELLAARSIYTDSHPEVESAQRAYDTAKARYDAAAIQVATGDNEHLRLDGEIRWLQEVALGYQERAADYLRRVEATPAVGAELGGILREYDAVREKYATLLSRKVEAELAQDLERRQRGSLFRVVEPALPPLGPSKPKPLQVLMISFLVGLGVGLAGASYKASRDTSLRGAMDARQRLGLPVLASVPSLDKRTRRAGPVGE